MNTHVNNEHGWEVVIMGNRKFATHVVAVAPTRQEGVAAQRATTGYGNHILILRAAKQPTWVGRCDR